LTGQFEGEDITGIRTITSSLVDDENGTNIADFRSRFISNCAGSRRILVDHGKKGQMRDRVKKGIALIPSEHK